MSDERHDASGPPPEDGRAADASGEAAPVRTKPRINRQRGAACACDEGARAAMPALRYGGAGSGGNGGDDATSAR